MTRCKAVRVSDYVADEASVLTGPSLRGRLPRRHLSTSHFEVRVSGEMSLYDVPRELLGRGLLDAARHFSVELWWVLGAGEDAECERRR